MEHVTTYMKGFCIIRMYLYLWTHEELTSVLGSRPCEMGLVHKSRFMHH